MTSTHVGLPDRYRPLDEVGAAETTPTGVIHTWRAKDRVLNRDVAIRVHTPGGPAAHAWIARALTAGGLATPALAMVYDASEGSEDAQGGGAAYVVNEWIDGETLPERLARGPMADREARTVLRRLAEGVAEAHRVGLAVGGLTPDNVVLRPNGLVGLRGVPAATGSVAGDITALGALLEFCLTGSADAATDQRRSGMAPDLAALVRRARSTEPGQGLSSVAAMASLLNDRPHGATRATEFPRGAGARTEPAVDRPRQPEPVDVPTVAPTLAVEGALPPRPEPVGRPVPDEDAWRDRWDGEDADDYAEDDGGVLPDEFDDDDGIEEPSARRRLLVVGLPLLALAIVIGLAVWFGSSVLSVAGSVDEGQGSTPPVTSAPTTTAAPSSTSAALGAPVPVTAASVFDPYGDGDSENKRQVPLAYDGDPSTAWKTLNYKGSAHFGNLKPGVGVLFDLGSAQRVGGVILSTTLPGSTVEVRTGDTGTGTLDAYTVAGTATLDTTTPVRFPKAATTRYVLVWFTGLVPDRGAFSADLAEITVQQAG
jgi:hypothetical protein